MSILNSDFELIPNLFLKYANQNGSEYKLHAFEFAHKFL